MPLGQAAKNRLFVEAATLRQRGVSVDLAFDDRALKGAMRAADRTGAKLAVILGDDDLAAGTAVVKDLSTGDQQTVALEALTNSIQEML